MRLIKVIAVVALAAVGYQQWQKHETTTAISASTSANGFVPLPKFQGTDVRSVTIFAAENCPHDDAQRAEALADALRRNGIPVTRLHSANFQLTEADADKAKQINAVMTGEVPIVFIDGRARANPSFDDVMAEWKATHTL